MRPLDVLYADVDGTLLGPGGSLFADAGGRPTGRGARAVAALHEAGVRLVLVSGRTRARLGEVARVLGASAYVAELGALLVEGTDPRATVVPCFGSYRGPGSPFEAIARSGAAALLLERFRGRLELHSPWSAEPREATVLLRGLVDPEEAKELLERAGLGWLELRDNGPVRRPLPHLDLPEVRAYHLVPRGVGKAAAVRLHLERHGIDPGRAAAVGDGPADLEVGEVVGTVVLVGVPREAADARPRGTDRRIVAVEEPGPEGFARAVEALLGGTAEGPPRTGR
ncbi:MAG TPA: HAD family phosphatase [Actinomycetota bacterium]|nr:HAD family phosphatase [Actinomycetota bacterium]